MLTTRQLIANFLVFMLTVKTWAHVEIESEDYFFPLEPVINFCNLSEQCKHDWVQICGQDSLGIPRVFVDNCDLYEFNCDDKKQYRHVKMDVCNYEPAGSPNVDKDKAAKEKAHQQKQEKKKQTF